MGNLGYGYTPTHPGEVLRDEIECRGISLSRLARQMGVPYRTLNDILNERRSLTTRTAMRFEAALNVPADSLINYEQKETPEQGVHLPLPAVCTQGIQRFQQYAPSS